MHVFLMSTRAPRMKRWFCFFLFLVFSGQLFAQSSAEKISQYQTLVDKFHQEGNLREEAKYLNMVATLQWDAQQYQEALATYQKSLDANQALGNKNAVATILGNIGMIYGDLKNPDKSLAYFDKSVEMRKLMKDRVGYASELVNSTMPLMTLQKYKEVIARMNEALEIAIEFNNKRLIKTCYGGLSEAYDKLGDKQKAFDYTGLYNAFEKQIQNEDIQAKETEMNDKVRKATQRSQELEALNQRKESELETKNKILDQDEEKIKLEESQIARRRAQMKEMKSEMEQEEATLKETSTELETERSLLIVSITVIVAFVAMGAGLFFLVRKLNNSNKLLTSQKEEIEKQQTVLQEQHKEIEGALGKIERQNKDITSSINYAKRIQDSMLHPFDELQRLVPNSFLLFKPRDIVSGDFYWYYEIPSSKKTKDVAIMVADCTGHGVPGSMLSMLGMNILDGIAKDGIKSASQVLEDLHVGVRKALKQESNEVRDGMDLALVIIRFEEKVIEFSGAKNPMVYIQNGELTCLKGTGWPIGGAQKSTSREFEQHTIPLTSPTSVYLYSDGYGDQFGGEKGQKFMTSNLRSLFLEIHQEPFENQREKLDTVIEAWKGSHHKQIDDILIIGFQIA